MSTKTTLKRVALVAVAAMGLGLLSVAPSSAAPQSDTLTLGATATTVTFGTAASTTLTQTFIGTGLTSDTMTVTVALNSSPAGNSLLPTLTASTTANVNGLATASGLVGQLSDTTTATTQATGVWTLGLGSTAPVGTYVIKVTPAIGTGSYASATTAVQAPAVTWTVTVNAATAATADTTSTVYIASGTTAPTSTTDASAVNAPMAVGTQAANILVTPKLNSASSSVNLTATITGPGLIGLGTNTAAATGRSLTTGSTTSTAVTSDYVTVWPDGTAGTAQITISSGGVVLGTKTVTFYGAIATVTTTVVNSVIAVGSAGANVGAITAVAKDSLGNTVPVGTLYATSDTAGVVSNSYTSATIGGTTAGVATFTLNGVAAGTANITVGTGSSSAATGVINAAAVAVRVGSSTPATVAVTFDAASYTVGQTATVTVTLKDAAGNAVPNGTYANIFDSTGLVSNYALGGVSLPTTGITTSGSAGTATFKVSMPTFASSVTLSAVGGTGLPTALQGVAITSGSVDVTNADNSAAVDAANAATDAANYAADAADAATTAAQEATAAAQAAQDSADAATAAVVALGLRVDTLMASVRAQLTSLSNLLVRIIKKTKA